MATATCTACGREVGWRATRGQRLADRRSSCCGASLLGKTAGQASPTKGRAYSLCAVCGERRLHVRRPDRVFRVRVEYRQGPTSYPPGAPVCIWHEIRYLSPCPTCGTELWTAEHHTRLYVAAMPVPAVVLVWFRADGVTTVNDLGECWIDEATGEARSTDCPQCGTRLPCYSSAPGPGSIPAERA